MSYLLANGYAVASGWVNVPRRGRMVAEVKVAETHKTTPILEGAAVVLEFQTGHTIKGTCVWAGADAGLWRVKVVGGANKIGQEARPKYYAGISSRSVIGDLLAEVGEVPGVLDVSGALERYVRMREPAYLALETLLHIKYPGHVWRTDSEGRINVVLDTFPIADTLTVSERYPAERRVVCLPRPELLPGVTLPNVGRVDSVRHTVGSQLRTEVLYL